MRKLMMTAATVAVMLAGAGRAAEAQPAIPGAPIVGTVEEGSWTDSVCAFGGDVCMDWHMTWAPITDDIYDGTAMAELTMRSTARAWRLESFTVFPPFGAQNITYAGEVPQGATFYTGDLSWTMSFDGFDGSYWPALVGFIVQADDAQGATEELAQIATLPTTVPEPASLALLATGLVGLGGVALRRRRAR